MRASAVAVAVTGVLMIAVPLGLLLGHNGLATAGTSRQLAIPTPTLVACDSGRPVGTRQLAPRQCARIRGSGFQPSEQLRVSDSRRPGWSTVIHADPSGRFEYRQVTVAVPGPDVLTFTGLNPDGDAVVPRMTFCRFTVTAGTGSRSS